MKSRYVFVLLGIIVMTSINVLDVRVLTSTSRYNSSMYASTLVRELKRIPVDIAGSGGVYDLAINGSDIFVVGSREPYGNGDSFLAKISADNGSEIWNVTWGSPWSDGASAVRINESKIYVIGGYAVSKNWDWNSELIRFNESGGKEIGTIWGTSNFDFGVFIEINGSAIYAGISTSYYYTEMSEDDFVIKKYDENGVEQWTYIYPGGKSDLLAAIAIDGEYVYACGGTYKYHNGTESKMGDAFLIKINGNNGQLVWAKYWGTDKYDFAADMVINGSKIYVVCNSFSNSWDLALLEYDINGNLISTTTWGDPAYNEKAITMSLVNNSILVVGTTNRDPSQDVFISKILPNRNVVSTVIGNNSYEVIASITVNGSTLIACGQDTINGTRRGVLFFFDITDNEEDGVIDSIEQEKGTNSNKSDTDDDGMPDWFEITFGLNPIANDASGDLDGDGLSNINEYLQKTNPLQKDSDGDGRNDLDEINGGTSPLIPDIAPQPSIEPFVIYYSAGVILSGVIVSVVLFVLFRRRSK
ncbi:MAG: hypothetical protein QXL15_01060 [Candidatus Korarchaeota archaeon]